MSFELTPEIVCSYEQLFSCIDVQSLAVDVKDAGGYYLETDLFALNNYPASDLYTHDGWSGDGSEIFSGQKTNGDPAIEKSLVHCGGLFREGELILKRGSYLSPQRVMLSSCTAGCLNVYRPLKIVFIPTGDEIVSGERSDLLSPLFYGFAKTLGFEITALGPVADDAGLLLQASRQAVEESDLVLVAGGSGGSSRDFGSELVERLTCGGHRFIDRKVKGVEVRNSNGKSVPLLLLPGNPAMVYWIFILVLWPRITAALGISNLYAEHETLNIMSSFNFSKAPDSTVSLPLRLVDMRDELCAMPFAHEPGSMESVKNGKYFVTFPQGLERVSVGDRLQVSLLYGEV